MSALTSTRHRFIQLCRLLPEDIILLLSRIAIASVFWRSVQTKISGWNWLDQSWQFFNLSQSTFLLFEHEYQLPLLPSTIAAYIGTTAEFFLPLLLVLGFGTRLSTLGLMIITCTIQFLVYPQAWPTHILWFAILLYLLRQGPGRLSLDYFLQGKS